MTTHKIVIDSLPGEREMHLQLTGPGSPELDFDDLNRALNSVSGMEAVKLLRPTRRNDSLEIVVRDIDVSMMMNFRFIEQLVRALLILLGDGASVAVIDLLYRHTFEARILHIAENFLMVQNLRPLTDAELTELLDDSEEPSFDDVLAGLLQAFSREEAERICTEAIAASPRETRELLSRKYGIPDRGSLSALLARRKL